MDSFPQPPSPLPPPPYPHVKLWIIYVPLIVFTFVICILMTILMTRHNDEESIHVDDESILRAQGDAASRLSRSAGMLAEVLKRVKIAMMMKAPDGFVFDKEKAKKGDEGGDAATECAICLEELKDGDLCKALPQCNHVFHKECIVFWLVMNKNTCPLCRAAPVAAASVENLPV